MQFSHLEKYDKLNQISNPGDYFCKPLKNNARQTNAADWHKACVALSAIQTHNGGITHG